MSPMRVFKFIPSYQGPNFGFRTRDSSHRNTDGNSWMRRQYIEVAMAATKRLCIALSLQPWQPLKKSGWNFVTGSS